MRNAKMLLNIITPCFRPVYLPLIACHLQSLTKFDIRWFIGFEDKLNQETPLGYKFGFDFRLMFENSFRSTLKFEIVCSTRDSRLPSVNGTAQRNEALDVISDIDSWVAFLDDDTLLQPEFERNATRAIEMHSDADGFIFQQIHNNGGLRMSVSSDPARSFVHDLPPYNGQAGCDTGQMLFKRKLIADVRWIHMLAADHRFYNDVLRDEVSKSKVRWLSVPASIHNALRK